MGIEPTCPLFRSHTGFEAQGGHQIRVHSRGGRASCTNTDYIESKHRSRRSVDANQLAVEVRRCFIGTMDASCLPKELSVDGTWAGVCGGRLRTVTEAASLVSLQTSLRTVFCLGKNVGDTRLALGTRFAGAGSLGNRVVGVR